jgi:hypothetical protein
VVGVAVLGPATATGTSAAGVTGAATGGTVEVVEMGCAHCNGVVVAGLVVVLGGALGLEEKSEGVGWGESRVGARGFLPRLALVVIPAPRPLARGVEDDMGVE